MHGCRGLPNEQSNQEGTWRVGKEGASRAQHCNPHSTATPLHACPAVAPSPLPPRMQSGRLWVSRVGACAPCRPPDSRCQGEPRWAGVARGGVEATSPCPARLVGPMCKVTGGRGGGWGHPAAQTAFWRTFWPLAFSYALTMSYTVEPASTTTCSQHHHVQVTQQVGAPTSSAVCQGWRQVGWAVPGCSGARTGECVPVHPPATSPHPGPGPPHPCPCRG